MRILIDTNVFISALLSAGRVPDLLLRAIRRRSDVVLYDERIVEEYRAVLSRPQFGFAPVAVEELVSSMLALGHRVEACDRWPGALIDEGDRMFVEVAVAGGADVLVTGNAKHYPRDLGFDVMGPTALLGVLESCAEA